MLKRQIAVAALIAATLAGCDKATPPIMADRPVRTITIEQGAEGEIVSLTGQVRAKDEVSLAFRVDGRMIERPVHVGDVLTADQLVARLDPQIQDNALRSAQANLASVEAVLTQARLTFQRQQQLLKDGWATRANFDEAQQKLLTVQAQVDSAQAQARIAHEQQSYAMLFADSPGAVTAVGAEPGEVVHAGQMVVQLAREGGRDAVFDVPEQLIRNSPPDTKIDIALSNDPQVKATGRVREVSPQADGATRTFQVKVGITEPPAAMKLGDTVVGHVRLTAPPGVEVPASALTETDGRPAVWVVDPAEQDRVAPQRRSPALRSGLCGDLPGPGKRRAGCHRRRADAAPGPEGPPPGSGLMNLNLTEWAIRHRSLVIYFMLVIVVAGVGSYFRLGRSEDPDFTVKTMVVQVGWPGATVSDTLEQITDRLERKLEETPNLDYLKSYTTAGQATVFVNLKDSTPAAKVPDIWYQVRKKIYDIRNDLPQGIVGPGFNDEFGDTYGIVYGFTADGFTHRELRDAVDDIRKQLLELPDISKIDVLGAQDERVYVEFSTEQLAGLGIDRAALIAALNAQNAVTPQGVVQTADEKILVRVSGAFRSEQDILAVNFAANGRMVRLGDIARVTRGPADPAQPMFRVNGKEGIGLAIAMRKGGDVLALGRNVERAMTEIKANLPVGIEPTLVANQPVTVEHAVADFMEALWEAIAIVLGVSLLALGLRAGAVVALSIPLVLAVVFMTMSAFGIDLQRISLGALIIALGLLVDDAMITIELMVTRLERGDEKDEAARFAYSSTAYPRLAGTLVTIAAFVPIGFARSAAGEYTFSIFAVVGIALIASWCVAALFTPMLGVWVLKKPKTAHPEAPGPAMRAFRAFLALAMRARWVTIGATLALFAVALFGMGFVPQQFFPASDRPELLVDLQLPENASISATNEASARLDKLLKDDQDIDHWSAYVGQGAVRFYLPLNVQLPNDFFAQAVVVTKGLEQRERVKAKLERALAADFPNAVGRVYPLELGPPVGWPLQYRVSGREPEEVRKIASKVAELLGSVPGAANVNYNWMEPGRTIKIRVDQDQARLLGLSSQQLSLAVNAVVSGVTATQMRSGIWLDDVLVRASAEQRMSLSTIRTLQVPLPNGKTVPLSQIASVEYGQEYPIVWRRDRLPTVTVQADLAPGTQAATVVQELTPKMAALNAGLPSGYQVSVGGSVEESGKAQTSVIVVVPLMLVIMLTVLMVQLQSFSSMILVMSVAPMGVIGVVAALLLADKPLGFVAILGVLALTGMIARNSVILIDQIETDKAKGLHPWDAVVEATSHRVRPILLTASAAILGMVPIAPTIFWGPMAYAIMGGLAGATALTLVFLPALYVAWFRIERPEPDTRPKIDLRDLEPTGGSEEVTHEGVLEDACLSTQPS